MGAARGASSSDPFDWDNFCQLNYGPTVRLAGLLLGDYQSGEDVAQEAFARLFEARQKAVDPQRYVRGIVVNICRSRIRRAVVVRRHPQTGQGDDPGYEETADRVGDRMVLRDGLLGLPVRQRAAVVLRFYADLAEADIAEVMGISVGSVKAHLHRGLLSLGQRLEGHL